MAKEADAENELWAAVSEMVASTSRAYALVSKAIESSVLTDRRGDVLPLLGVQRYCVSALQCGLLAAAAYRAPQEVAGGTDNPTTIGEPKP